MRDSAVMLAPTEIFANRHLLLVGTLLCATLTSASCGGALFKVKPIVELPPLPDSSRSTSVGGLTLKVAPLLSDEDSQELFEANLPMAGLLPIRVELIHESGMPVELKRARFRLRDGQAREWKHLSAKQASARILKANKVFAYNPNSRKLFEKEFAAYELDLRTPLANSEQRRRGFLFFQSPDKAAPVNSLSGLTLIVERLPKTVEIPLP